MSESHYDTAQVCENGHIINSMARDHPDRNQDYCDECGAKTIMACPDCGKPIRGHHHIPDGSEFFDSSAPRYCHKCGQPFPWTKAALEAARELADTFDDLSDMDRDELKKSLEDLLRETPRTRVAETKFKKVMRKVGKEAYERMKSILTDIVSETIKKTIFE